MGQNRLLKIHESCIMSKMGFSGSTGGKFGDRL